MPHSSIIINQPPPGGHGSPRRTLQHHLGNDPNFTQIPERRGVRRADGSVLRYRNTPAQYTNLCEANDHLILRAIGPIRSSISSTNVCDPDPCLPGAPSDLYMAPICFAANTPINTDQGIVKINHLDKQTHTINNKQIIDITKSVSNDNHLVRFKKHALGHNLPTHRTVMTKEHMILHKDVMVEAGSLVKHFKGVNTIPYNGEILYNVLMEKHEMMTVNNMVCETLHPATYIALKLCNDTEPKPYKLLKTMAGLFKQDKQHK